MTHTNQKVFIGVAIPYVNAKPHIGYAMELMLADNLARYHRLIGNDVFLLNGTDENALKNVESAKKAGKETNEFIDGLVKEYFEPLKPLLNLSNDGFIRTSSEQHKLGAQKLWKMCAHDIYKKTYTGLYCTGCETFYKDGEFEKNICAIHGKPLEEVHEENYFFALSRYTDKLRNLIENDIIKLYPESKKQEMLNFIDKGLEDFSVSRPITRSKGFGIEVPGDALQTIYVWFDALANYLTGVGFGTHEEQYKDWWNEESIRIQIIGKDIIKFHMLYYPAMLMSAGLSLPTDVIVHEFITVDGKKMSKSLGNVLYPQDIVEKVGIDPYRYYTLKEASPFEDMNFSFDRLYEVYNKELANEFGNLVMRLTTLANKDKLEVANFEHTFLYLAKEYGVHDDFITARSNLALNVLSNHIKELNKNVDEFAPWSKSASERKDFLLQTISSVRDCAILLQSVMPETSKKIIHILSGNLEKAQPLFPKKSV